MTEQAKAVRKVSAYVMGSNGKLVAGESHQLLEDPWNYETDGVVRPPYDPELLAYFLEINSVHYRCCKAKAADVAGRGYLLKAVNGQEGNNANRAVIEEFLASCNNNPEMTLREALEMAWVDYEAVGWLALEITRNGKGIPDGIYWVPAHTVRVKKDKSGFVQKRDYRSVFFKHFGDERPWDIKGQLTEGAADIERANELIFIRNLHPKSSYYGIPDFLPALGAMSGNMAARDYNLDFFENNAVPQYAVIVENATVDDTTQKTIEDYFKQEIKGKGNNHATLVLGIPPSDETEAPIKVQFVPLAKEIKDASFRLFKQDNRDEVLCAHGVPPAVVGIIETAHLGSGTGDSQVSNYKDRIVEPRQEILEHRFNKTIIRIGFGIEDWEWKLNDIDTDDEKRNADIDLILFGMASITPNQIRDKRGLEKREDEFGDDYYLAAGYTNASRPPAPPEPVPILPGLAQPEPDDKAGQVAKALAAAPFIQAVAGFREDLARILKVVEGR